MTERKPKRKIPLDKFFPNGFDKTDEKNMMQLTVLIQEKAAEDPRYKGYSVYRISPDGSYAIIAPMEDGDVIDPDDIGHTLPIEECTDPGKQPSTVRRMQERHPGYVVVDFARTSATEGIVRMSQLDDKTIAVRQRFADVFGLKKTPWLIRVSKTPEHGWKIRIKEGAAVYQPSKHDAKIQEAAELIGKPGWFFKADPDNNVIVIYPGELPTFPATIPVPKKLWTQKDIRRSWFGMKLPDRGRKTGDILYNDWKNAPGMLVSGASGGGKSVIINSLIYGHVAAGGQLAIVDDADKSVDYAWCRPWVMDMGWGCDGIESSAAVLQHVLDLCAPRSEVIKRYRKENWWDLPDDVKKQYPPILLVCDEISQWAVAPKIPTGLEKDNPMLIRAKYENSIDQCSFMNLTKISQKARFVGIRFLYAAQSATAQAGLDPKVRINLPSKILAGEKVQDTVREQVLNDAKHAPYVPLNVIRDGVGKGTGIAELAGQEACVYKGFFENEGGRGFSAILEDHLRQAAPPTGNENSGHLSWEQIINLVPAAAEKPDDGSFTGDDETPSRLESEGGFGEDGRDVADRDAPLKGAARAAHASRLTALEEAQRIAKQSAQMGL